MLIVGGWDGYKALKAVDVFDTDNMQWLTPSPTALQVYNEALPDI